MDLLTIVFLLLVALVLSNIIGHFLPSIPIALIQIVLGVLVAVLHGDYDFQIGAEWFLLLFVAPLLYNDGRHFSLDELWDMRSEIFGNAFILVILTTLVGGYVIYQIIPGLPLAAALALAAILSPTDPVAVNGIAKRVKVPEKVMVVVRGESLINDASGLIAFKYAVAAAVTGYFSLQEAVLDFSYTFLAGALAGLLLGLFIIFFRFWLRQRGIQDPVFHSLFLILIPFGIFFVTEHFLHASGIIAVVAAGIVHAIIAERTETYLAEEHLLAENAWAVLLFVLNGFVFLLLGMNIPSAMFDAVINHEVAVRQALGYVVVTGLAVLAVRFVWTLISKAYVYYLQKRSGAEKPDVKMALITTLAGVRGAVTMAGVLTIPVVIGNGAAFPLRSLLVFMAAGVILLTLIVATIFLPILCRKGAVEESEKQGRDLTWAKNRLLLAAVRTIRLETTEENEAAAAEPMTGLNISMLCN